MAKEPTNTADVVEYQAETLGEKPFLYFEDQVISFAELNRRVNRIANGLRPLGLEAGVGAAVMMGNSPEFFYVYLAITKLGGYVVPVNTGLKADGLRHIIDYSDSKFLVVDATFIEAIQGIESGLAKLEHIVVNREDVVTTDDGTLPRTPNGWLDLATVMQASDENAGIGIKIGEMAALMYTSGTTGAPKGVVTRYRPAAGPAQRPAQRVATAEDEMMYTCLPLFHANALFLTSVRALTTGTPMALSRRFSASRFWDEIRRYGVTTFNALGAMIPILLKQPKRDNDADNPVRRVMSAACPVSVWEEFEQRYQVKLFEGYASVDGGGFSVGNYGNGPVGSIGKPTTEYRIVDDDDNDVPVGESGELIFKIENENLRRVEYYKNPEASAAKIAGGWLRTGDMVHADADGYLYFDDRKTDSLRRRGENISAWEVERAINTHPAVLESAVFGVPSDLGEDEVMVVAMLQPGASLDPEELIAHCESRLARFMIPRYVEFRTELPKTGTHRTQKAVLKQEGVGPNTWDREAGR